MAGTFMIRKERDGQFHAKPTFVCKGMGYEQSEKMEAIGNTPEIAFVKLVPMMPIEIQAQMNAIDRWDFYSAPEYIHIADKCVDLDRHKPTREERYRRRTRFLIQVALGRVESTWDLTSLR